MTEAQRGHSSVRSGVFRDNGKNLKGDCKVTMDKSDKRGAWSI